MAVTPCDRRRTHAARVHPPWGEDRRSTGSFRPLAECRGRVPFRKVGPGEDPTRPHGHEQRKRGEAVEITRQIEHEVSEIVRAAVNQIHQQKRQITEDVDAGISQNV